MKKLIITALVAFPAITSAANLSETKKLVESAGDIISLLVRLAMAVALLVFFWGLVGFIRKAGDEAEVKKSKGIMIWGTVALFVLISIWGLVRFLQTELGITVSDTPIVTPKIPTF